MNTTGGSNFICVACGTQFPESADPPPSCPICRDVRQFVPIAGQRWTTLPELRSGHRNAFEQYESGLTGVGTVPEFAIGQRALVVRSAAGSVLWDCISLVDDATVEIIAGLGKLTAIAISHPHYYTTMLEWSRAFGRIPIYLHASDREWVQRHGPEIQFWEGGSFEIGPGLSLVRCGGHFPGGTVLHWREGAEGRGALLTGDILQVTPDGRVSFMLSYPNLLPLSARAVDAVVDALKTFRFDRIYGAWWNRTISHNAEAIVVQSRDRYLACLRN